MLITPSLAAKPAPIGFLYMCEEGLERSSCMFCNWAYLPAVCTLSALYAQLHPLTCHVHEVNLTTIVSTRPSCPGGHHCSFQHKNFVGKNNDAHLVITTHIIPMQFIKLYSLCVVEPTIESSHAIHEVV